MPPCLDRWSNALIGRVWRCFSRQPFPPQLSSHLKQFLGFGGGVLAARVLSATSQIVIGRTLGPHDYGELTVVLLLAGYFVLPISGGWGLAFIKIVSGAKDRTSVDRALAALLLISVVAALALFAGLTLIHIPLSHWLNIAVGDVRLAMLITLAYAWWLVSRQIAQAFQAWGRYVLIEFGWSLTVLTMLLLLLRASSGTVPAIGVAFFSGYLLAGFGCAPLMLRSLRAGWHLAPIKAIVSHGSLLMFSTLATTAAFGLDRLMIHRTLGASQVGLYQAHFLSTYGIVGALITIAITYAFPLFCQDDQNRLGRTLATICKWQYLLTFIVSALVGRLMLGLFGYPLYPPLFLCLCAFNAVQVHVQLDINYLASQGIATTRQTLVAQLVFLAVNIASLTTLVANVGILSGGIALLAAALAALFTLSRFKGRLSGR